MFLLYKFQNNINSFMRARVCARARVCKFSMEMQALVVNLVTVIIYAINLIFVAIYAGKI